MALVSSTSAAAASRSCSSRRSPATTSRSSATSLASRRALAFALGVDERALAAEYAAASRSTSSPSSSPRRRSVTGCSRAGRSISRSFPCRATSPATRAVTSRRHLVARDPDPASRRGLPRFQLKGPGSPWAQPPRRAADRASSIDPADEPEGRSRTVRVAGPSPVGWALAGLPTCARRGG